jgi:hypothetical protein
VGSAHWKKDDSYEMKGRHRIALLAMFAALLIFYRGSHLQPRWAWSSLYWALIVIALIAVIRGRRKKK